MTRWHRYRKRLITRTLRLAPPLFTFDPAEIRGLLEEGLR